MAQGPNYNLIAPLLTPTSVSTTGVNGPNYCFVYSNGGTVVIGTNLNYNVIIYTKFT